MIGPERTYQWLEVDNIKLDTAAQVMLDNLHSAINDGEFALALDLQDELKATTRDLDECGRARVYIECARAYHQMHETDQAIEELEAALQILESVQRPDQVCLHTQALVNWMLGAFFWRYDEERQSAINVWRKGLKIFNNLILDPKTIAPETAWYKDRYAEMVEKFKEALQTAQPIPLGPRPGGWPVNLPPATLQPGALKSIDVIGVIPAGGFGPTGATPQSIDRVRLQPDMDEFLIEDTPHQLFNLRGLDRIISLQSSSSYYFLKVDGDSMNKAGIDSGDYVLLRYQDDASYGDIVAAEIVDVDSRATLKSYSRERANNDEEKVILRPQSTNEDHQSFTFTKATINFFIRGVALGVFKAVS